MTIKAKCPEVRQGPGRGSHRRAENKPSGSPETSSLASAQMPAQKEPAEATHGQRREHRKQNQLIISEQ